MRGLISPSKINAQPKVVRELLRKKGVVFDPGNKLSKKVDSFRASQLKKESRKNMPDAAQGR